MKIKEIPRIVKFGLIITVTGIFLMGCAAIMQRDRGIAYYQAYSGPALPREQVALLVCPRDASCAVTNVDGRLDWLRGPRSPEYPHGIGLLPGKHTITFLPVGSASGAPIDKEINVEAGKIYGVHFAIVNAHKVSSSMPGYITYEGQEQLTITSITNVTKFFEASKLDLEKAP